MKAVVEDEKLHCNREMTTALCCRKQIGSRSSRALEKAPVLWWRIVEPGLLDFMEDDQGLHYYSI